MAGLSIWISKASDEMLLSLIADGQFVAKLLTLVTHANSVQIGATSIRILGRMLSSYNDTLSSAIVDSGLLQQFVQLIDYEKPVVRKEVIWSLSNILARSPERIQMCIDLGLVEKLIGKMAVD